MGIVSFVSLKGGVGKTSLSINVAHSFAETGCKTAVIDLDPTAHLTRLFSDKIDLNEGATLPHLLRMPLRYENGSDSLVAGDGLIEQLSEFVNPFKEVRKNLFLVQGGEDLRHFLWGKGSKVWSSLFPKLIEEMSVEFDHIIIDTAPDFNVLSRNAIASSDLVCVPIDSSEMGIFGLKMIFEAAKHIKAPAWAVIRSMVNKSASRISALSMDSLNHNFSITNESKDFLDQLRKFEEISDNNDVSVSYTPQVYLLNSFVQRTEQQNRLTFLKKTAFDLKLNQKLANDYSQVAREVEGLMELEVELEEESEGYNIMQMLSERSQLTA